MTLIRFCFISTKAVSSTATERERREQRVREGIETSDQAAGSSGLTLVGLEPNTAGRVGRVHTVMHVRRALARSYRAIDGANSRCFSAVSVGFPVPTSVFTGRVYRTPKVATAGLRLGLGLGLGRAPPSTTNRTASISRLSDFTHQVRQPQSGRLIRTSCGPAASSQDARC